MEGKNMNKTTSSILIIMSILTLAMVILPANAQYIEVRGKIANETAGRGYIDLSTEEIKWGPKNFPALFMDIDNDLGSENIVINQSGLSGSSRTINKGNLIYTTKGDNKILNVIRYAFGGNYTKAKNKGLFGFDAGKMSSENGKFKVVGLNTSKYIAIKNQTNKLVKLAIEQKSENKTMKKDDVWNIGYGWQLTVASVDAKARPKKVWLVLYKNGIKLDDAVKNEGDIYTYVNGSLAGEPDVPLFVVYINNITQGTTSDIVKFKYTWAIDTNVTKINVGDVKGKFRTVVADQNRIVMRNMDYPITLCRGCVINIVGSAGIRVADKPFLRFYPKVDYNVC